MEQLRLTSCRWNTFTYSPSAIQSQPLSVTNNCVDDNCHWFCFSPPFEADSCMLPELPRCTCTFHMWKVQEPSRRNSPVSRIYMGQIQEFRYLFWETANSATSCDTKIQRIQQKGRVQRGTGSIKNWTRIGVPILLTCASLIRSQLREQHFRWRTDADSTRLSYKPLKVQFASKQFPCQIITYQERWRERNDFITGSRDKSLTKINEVCTSTIQLEECTRTLGGVP